VKTGRKIVYGQIAIHDDTRQSPVNGGGIFLTRTLANNTEVNFHNVRPTTYIKWINTSTRTIVLTGFRKRDTTPIGLSQGIGVSPSTTVELLVVADAEVIVLSGSAPLVVIPNRPFVIPSIPTGAVARYRFDNDSFLTKDESDRVPNIINIINGSTFLPSLSNADVATRWPTLLNPSSFNAKRALRFNRAASQYLGGPNNFGASPAYTICIAFRYLQVSTSHFIASMGGGGQTNGQNVCWPLTYNQPNWGYRIPFQDSPSMGAASAGFWVYFNTSAGTNQRTAIMNSAGTLIVDQATAFTHLNALNQFYLGFGATDNGYADMELYEFAMWNRILDATERAETMSTLRLSWI
jgi:hypothetical protein